VFIATQPVKRGRQQQRTRQPLSGPAMKKLLSTAGIDVQQSVRSRATGHYVVNIFNPGLQTPVAPAKEWTQKMLSAFEGIRVVDAAEARAGWRKDNPVIMVDITFTDEGIKPKLNTNGPLDDEWQSAFNLFMCLG
jgi:hypothetical protein